MSEHITTRFGALDSRLAAAVRHALDVAVTFTALTRLNEVHLRIAAMTGVVHAHRPVGEPPSHNWREFIVDMFGRNSVGCQRSPVGLRPGDPTAATRERLAFVTSYRLSAEEQRMVGDLVAAAGAFIVAEATSLAGFLDDHEPARGGSQVVDELTRTLLGIGQIGVRLMEVAATGTWATLLTSRLTDAVPVPRTGALVRRTRSTDLWRPSPGRDRVVLMVDPMDRTCQRTLTRHALVTLGESMAGRGDSALPTLVVMSTVSSVSPVRVDLGTGDTVEQAFSDTEEWFTSTLDRVSRAVETFNHHDTGPPRPVTDAVEERERPFESLHTAVQNYQPLMLIVLANSASITSSDRYLDRRRNTPLAPPAATESLNGVSVAVISFCPPEVGLRSLARAWSAAGAKEIRYRCLGPGEGDDCAEEYFAEASYVTRRTLGEPVVPRLTPLSPRSRVVCVGAVFAAAAVLTVGTVLIWGIHAESNIFGLAIGLFSGAALAWSARQWRRGGAGSVRRAVTRGR